MGFKANIDIALSFSTLKFCSVRQQGKIKFRICLYYTLKPSKSEIQESKAQDINFCHPYSIVRKAIRNHNKPSHSLHLSPPMFLNEQSELDLGSDFYISRPYRVLFEREVHNILETCCFRISIDVQKYEDVELRCQVELLFCPNSTSQETATFKIIGKCVCKIRKIFDVSAYLPVSFDEFEGVAIEGVYQAALIDFKYERDQFQKAQLVPPENFHEYLKRTTNGFNRAEVRNFYKYYRDLLEKELFSIQSRHYDLVRVLGLSSSKEYTDFRILRVNLNSKIENMIDHLGGYNSHQNPYYFNNKKSLTQLSVESLSTNFDERELMYINRGIITRKEHQPRIAPNSESYKEDISEEIMFDFLQIKALIYKKWSEYLQFTNDNLSALTQRYRSQYNFMVKQRLSGNVFSHRVLNCDDWRRALYEDSGKEHMRIAETDRNKIQKDEQLWKESFVVENMGFFMKDAKNIKIFEEIYPICQKQTKIHKTLIKRYSSNNTNQIPQKRSLSNFELPHQQQEMKKNNMSMEHMADLKTMHHGDDEQDEDHFIVLVHGFQASRQDFVLIKTCLEIRFKIKVYISTANEGRTDDDIELQGKRLALELEKFLNDSTPTPHYRLSFLGHSMGGVIIRTALCYLEGVSDHLYSYISLSTPHLGYLYQPSTHIQAGLWLLSAIQKTPSLEQLSLKDSDNVRGCFLYRLSRSKSLNNFRHLALVGSHLDKYVPYESARVEYNESVAVGEVAKDGVLEEMVDGMLGALTSSEISRMDVIFSIDESNFDTMIGRTAHIRYLSDRQFIKVFCIVFEKFFK